MAINYFKRSGVGGGLDETQVKDLGIKLEFNMDELLGVKKQNTSSGSGYAPKSSGGAPSSGVTREQAAREIDALTDTLYEQMKPEQVVYEARSEDELRTSIAEWLRPSYERAISARREQTSVYRAELDADAIARGMGASTYVTDVKGRQLAKEARDVSELESEYGAALAARVFESAEAERTRATEVAQFNASQNRAAYEMAYAAAQVLYTTYRGAATTGTGGSGGGSGGRSGSAGKNDSSKVAGDEETWDYDDIATTSAENCEKFLDLLSQQERTEVYSGTTTQGRKYRAELVKSLGFVDYIKMQMSYPGKP